MWTPSTSDISTAAQRTADAAAGAPPVITFKGDIWRRATDSQATVIDMALQQLPLRQKRLWDDAQYLDHADPLVDMLRAQMTAAFGEAEAIRILAPSE